MKRFEYAKERNLDQSNLAFLGMNGWELVAIVNEQSHNYGVAGYKVKVENKLTGYFKREIIEHKNP